MGYVILVKPSNISRTASNEARQFASAGKDPTVEFAGGATHVIAKNLLPRCRRLERSRTGGVCLWTGRRSDARRFLLNLIRTILFFLRKAKLESYGKLDRYKIPSFGNL